ncbi:hypothetical protein [Bradyrhizobium sacchari]|nr:hypothetical protein [Bradyrhizobium sacchari]
MSKIDDAQQAENQCEAGRDDEDQRREGQAVQDLKEIDPHHAGA